MSPAALAAAFGLYVAGVAALLVGLAFARLPVRQAAWVPLLLASWVACAGVLSATGVLRSPSRPPGIALLVVPVLVSMLATAGFGALGRALALRVPLAWLVGLQVFRVGVEGVLHGLWQAGWVPHAMTLGGGNVEVLFAASAPVLAWAVASGRVGARFVRTWTALGLLSLINVVVRAVGSAPGPTHFLATEVPNIAMAQFPFVLIPAVMVPLALALHLVTWRATASSPRSAQQPMTT